MPGFRMRSSMVSKWWMRPSESVKRDQSKIYAESNRSTFLQIFRVFHSMQTLAVYRGLLPRQTIARSTATNEEKVGRGRLDVLPAAHGVLARAGAGAVAPGEDA